LFQRQFWLATAALAITATPALAQQAPRAAPAAKPAAPPAVGEVLIQGTPPPVRTSIDRNSYSVANDLQATTGSIGDALRNVPSVEVDVNGNVSLRGDPNVTIMIDGKPSGMFRGEGKGQALQNLPANQIERVEVITNPSAAFNPEGTAGVINLVTKKTAKPGVSGSVRASVGSEGRQNGGANLTYRDGALTLSNDLYLRHDSLKQTFSSDRSFVDAPGGVVSERRETRTIGTVEVMGLRSALDYDPDAKTRLSAELDYNGVTFDNHQIESLRQATTGGPPRVGFDGQNAFIQERDNLELTLGYRKKYAEDHEFNVTFVRELNDEDRSRPAIRQFSAPTTGATFDVPEYRNHFWRTQLKADYSRPLPGEVKLKLGYEFNADDNDYTLVYGRGPLGGPVTIDPTRSNLFRFDQQIHSAYVTYERPMGDFTALAGLRVEATQIDLDQVTQGLRDENNYVRFYPSLHLSYVLNEHQQLKASYSRRVQRPNPQDYNPFRIFFDPRNLLEGNPDLKPQVTDSFELGYQRRQNGTTLLATGYYRRGQDAVNDIFRDLGGGVILQTKENIGSFQTAGVELVANGRLPGKLSYNISGNVLWSEIDARDLGFGAGKRSAYTAFGRASLNWQATDRDFFQVQGFLNGKALLSQGYREPQGGVNLGYRHKFSDQLSAVVTVQDTFDTIRFRSVVETSTYREVNRGVPQNRAVFVGFTYSFGGGRQRDNFDFGSGGGAPSP